MKDWKAGLVEIKTSTTFDVLITIDYQACCVGGRCQSAARHFLACLSVCLILLSIVILMANICSAASKRSKSPSRNGGRKIGVVASGRRERLDVGRRGGKVVELLFECKTKCLGSVGTCAAARTRPDNGNPIFRNNICLQDRRLAFTNRSPVLAPFLHPRPTDEEDHFVIFVSRDQEKYPWAKFDHVPRPYILYKFIAGLAVNLNIWISNVVISLGMIAAWFTKFPNAAAIALPGVTNEIRPFFCDRLENVSIEGKRWWI